jgi:membrane carboxypeptidase/penicillin-binding protein
VLARLDEPIMTDRGPWLPGGEHERTEYTLRTALKISSNRAAAHLLQQVGIGQAAYYAQRLGIASQLPSVPSLALGTGGVTLLELTSAYGVFANHGLAVAPRLILRVDDRDGHAIFDDPGAVHQALTPATAFLMSSMLADVLTSGTATGARAAGFKLPAAGKTGTADNFTDAWFIGYTPHLVTGVWFGMDKPAPIMNRGFAAVVAVPAWAEFMKQATAKDPPDWFDVPPDVEKVTICRVSGLRATDGCRHGTVAPGYVQAGLTELPGVPVGDSAAVGTSGHAVAPAVAARPAFGVYDEYFPIGAAPSETCPVHGTHAIGLNGEADPAPVGTTGLIPAGYSRPPASRVEKVVGTDGRITWVIKE